MYPAFSKSTQKKLIDRCPVNWISSISKSENTLTVPKCVLPSPRLPQSFINHCSHSAQSPISQCLFLILILVFLFVCDSLPGWPQTHYKAEADLEFLILLSLLLKYWSIRIYHHSWLVLIVSFLSLFLHFKHLPSTAMYNDLWTFHIKRTQLKRDSSSYWF